MSHKRKLIRQEIVAALKNELTLVEDLNIFESRVEPIFERSKLPAIAVYTRAETSERFAQGSHIYNRSLSLAVEILVQGNADSDDKIDDICKEIEGALNSSKYERSENYESIELTATDIAFVSEGRLPKAAARLNYEIEYQSDET